ncbi:MAG TPA: YdcF family protein [Rectinemataceae bacterium]|nr:YdcF family protein [Rectinemataceae bacterium]
MFMLGKVLAFFAFPPGLIILFGLLSLILLFLNKRKAALGVSTLALILFYLLSMNAFSNLLIAPLENRYPPISKAEDSRAIVVLGGGYNDRSPEYNSGPALTPAAEKRVVYGLELSKRFDLPLIFSGGKGYNVKTEGTEADAADRLWRTLGVAGNRITLEKESLDTKTNASGVSAIIKGERVILVTSAFHMPRAMFSFEKAGIHAIPAPTDYRAKRSALTWTDYLPDISALENSNFALHEYVGLAYYHLIFLFGGSPKL